MTLPRGVILPEANTRFAWDSLVLLQIVVITFMVPYQASFLDSGVAVFIFVLDTFMDTVFAMDIYARLSKFAIMKDGVSLVEPSDFKRVYLKTSFFGDVLASIPLSTIGYICKVRDRRYGVLRFFQFCRLRHFGKYLSAFVENVNTKTKFAISTAQLRLIQIFFIVLFLCHWFACAFHLLGHVPEEDTWLVLDDSASIGNGARYLRSFYWSLYTGKWVTILLEVLQLYFHNSSGRPHSSYLFSMIVTTIGYGSIPVVTNTERVFAMVVMIIGAVICDAGITAILTSIISIRDQQSGTNNRRIQCTKRYMVSNMLNKDVQNRILDYYKYDDTELQNIREEEILFDLSSTLRNEILRHFCFESLRSSDLISDISDGALGSIIRMMKPYLAVPNENLSIIGEECERLYVLKRGSVQSVDTTGSVNLLQTGYVIGHFFTASAYKQRGLPTKVLEIEIVSTKGLKTKYGIPYAIFTFGKESCRSAVRKTMRWKEFISMKYCGDENRPLQIEIRSWQSGQVHAFVGSTEISISECTKEKRQVSVKDKNGKVTGILHFNLTARNLRPNEKLSTHEKTTASLGYSHLYSLDTYKFQDLLQYLEVSKHTHASDRLRGPFLEFTTQENLTEKERIKHCWRRPSRPSIHVKTPKYEVGGDRLSHRKAIQRPSIAEGNDISSSSSENNNNVKKSALSKMKSMRPVFGRMKSSTVIPTADEDDPESGQKEVCEDNERDSGRKSWSGSNIVRTKTLALTSTRNVMESEVSEIEYLSENDRSFDVLADVNGESSRFDKRPSRRATVHIEWTKEKSKRII